jgi:hypothetical protein
VAGERDVKLRTGRFWRDGDVLWGKCFEGAEETLDDAKEQVAAQRAMLDDGPLPFIMDIRGVRSLARESRMYFASAESAQVFRATALIVASPLSRAIGNFFLGLNKAQMPTRLFTSEEDALAWARSFLSAK